MGDNEGTRNSGGGDVVTDGKVSRRMVLGAIAGAGALGSGVSSTASILRDESSFEGLTVSAGSLDIETCWEGGDDCDASLAFSVGPDTEEGSERIEYEIPDDSNAAYVWVRTPCPEDVCGLYEKLKVTITDGTEGEGGEEVASGSLCEVLSDLHSGVALNGGDAVEPGEERWLNVAWELDSPLAEDDTVDAVGFEFFASQARHVGDPEETNPWAGESCDDVDCEGTGECDDNGDGPDWKGISWVGFCADEGIDGDVDFTIDDGTLSIEGDLPDGIHTVLLKQSTDLYVFGDTDAGTYAVGDGEHYPQDRNEFPETDPTRSNSTPCPGECGLKYDIEAVEDYETERMCD